MPAASWISCNPSRKTPLPSKRKKGGSAEPPFSLLSQNTPARTRTADKLIKSQLLYQLSYGGISVTHRPSRLLTD